MYLYKVHAQQLLAALGEEIAAELKGKTDFMLSLMDEDDWSMIIKSHALIEALVTELIVAKIEEPNMKTIIERLPLSDEQIGKVRIAKDYGLLAPEERTFVRRFSELRNQLVHRFENVDFNIEKYVFGLNKGQREAWQKAFTWFEHGRQVKNSWKDATIDNPKTAVWLSAFMFVSLTCVKIGELKGYSSIRVASENTAKELLEKLV